MRLLYIVILTFLFISLNVEKGDGKPLLFRLIKNIFGKGRKKPSSYKPPPKSPTSGYERPPPNIPTESYKPPVQEPATTPKPSYLPAAPTPPPRKPLKPSYYAPPPPKPPQPVAPLTTTPPSVRPPTIAPTPPPSIRPPPPPIIAPPPPIPEIGPPSPPPQLFPPIDDNYFDSVQTELINPSDDRCSNPLPNCPQLYAPVCGSDGKTYDNDCLLYQAQCNDKSLVKARCSNSLAPSVSVIDAKSPPKLPSSNCETAFLKYKEAGCVVYDDIKCDDKDFGIGLMPGARRSFDQNARVNDISFKNNIEAVSVQQGCSLQMWTGEKFTGQTLVIKNTTPQSVLSALTRSNRDTGIHVNLKEDSIREKFNDNVNSLECLCETSMSRNIESSGSYSASEVAAPIESYGTSWP